jgi:hypothetical protein
MLSPVENLSPNHFQDPIEVLVAVRIQDPNDSDHERLDKSLALEVVFRRAYLKMAVPIQLDAKLNLDREKIDDKCSDTVLTPKLTFEQLMPLESRPEDEFGFGH